MKLKYGSDEYRRIVDQAEWYYRKMRDSTTINERDYWIRRSNNFAEQLREAYGHSDSEVEHIIRSYYLDSNYDVSQYNETEKDPSISSDEIIFIVAMIICCVIWLVIQIHDMYEVNTRMKKDNKQL